MRLPDSKDPAGSAEGAVLLKDVLFVLHKHGVTVIPSGTITKLERDGILEAHMLQDPVPGLMIKHLSRKFGIPQTEFYIAARQGIH